ncbi:triose-phosphate isomerase [Consotaella salsifontis]|uniref:Triosephosphate isomerase n=1 Tax=Consotaella salsifontis TaxID=1365950 RepID=A0A1T4TET7_9HYPH|nr:triose-phosphate isomerase [Consotaella salsifontis]SKA38831.1 triosephosphate isomerase [Consotaella salsifontis]
MTSASSQPLKKPLWIGTSWKMNKTIAEADAFCDVVRASPLASSRAPQLFVVPPFTVLDRVASALRGTSIMVGAQNVHWEDQGAWTGEISPVQVADCGASLVEIGHSERRTYFNETDETVGLKAAAAQRHGLIALICVGDSHSEHAAGTSDEAVSRQTRAALAKIDAGGAALPVIAYEPVWSIGEKGVPAEPDFVNAQHLVIKEAATAALGRDLPVLYGGSVSLANAVALASQPNVNGLFIGRAAWQADGFLAIAAEVGAACV